MTPALLLGIAMVGLAVTTISATGVQLLHEFARHRLEIYCRRRGRIDWFHGILDQREELALAAQTMQMIGVAVTVTCGLLWGFQLRTAMPTSLLELLGFVGLTTIVMLTANCWIPWGVQRIAAAPFLYRTWRLWWGTALVLRPLVSGAEVVSTLFHRAAGQPEEEDEEEAFEEEIRSMMSEGEHEGLIESDAREMIEGVIDLDDKNVARIMTPRSRVDALELRSEWNQILDFVVQCGRTRIPVFNGEFQQQSDIVGILFAKDLLNEARKPEAQRQSLVQLVRSPIVVPHSTQLDAMLKQFLSSRTHMAIVLDEYRSIAGVITIEDILEEIVGEITDETDREQPSEFKRIDHESILVEGHVHLEDLNDEFGLSLPTEEEFDTVAGYIMSRLSQIPAAGHQLVLGDVRFEVEQSGPRTIDRVKLTILHPSNGNDMA